MMSVVFDPSNFKLIYPSFATVPDVVLNNYFAEATLYIDNTDNSFVQDIGQRALLLNLLVAHIAALRSGENGQAPNGMVGRISSASQGSVSISSEYGSSSEMGNWFNQTRFGAEFWMLTAKYRTFRYVPPVRRGGFYSRGWQ